MKDDNGEFHGFTFPVLPWDGNAVFGWIGTMPLTKRLSEIGAHRVNFMPQSPAVLSQARCSSGVIDRVTLT